MVSYEPVIGLEVHAELLTQSKMFCGCPVVDSTMAEPNTTVCPICLGMPGVLPVINRRAVDYAIRVGLALNCEITPFNVFARKSYFYPDLPKGYQISQYELPLAVDGWLEIDTPTGPKRIGIRRVHMEEDTGKLTHLGESSLIDFNRSGVPLLEIVTEPDLRSVDEVKSYATKLRSILRYLEVNSGDMEKGVIRFEANISVRPAGSQALNERTEVKNLNSFRALVGATEYEIARQTAIWQSGGQVRRETMGWSEERRMTIPQRSKESASDYRYFPEPDLPPLEISREWVETVRAELPELPDARRDRFEHEYTLTHYDAMVLVAERAIADWFEQAIQAGKSRRVSPKAIANWVTGELFRFMKEQGLEINQVRVRPEQLAELISLVDQGTITTNTGKQVLEIVLTAGGEPETIIADRGWGQISDRSAVERLVEQTLAENPEPVQDYLSGKETLLRWFTGQVMKASRGQANPALVREVLLEHLARAGER